MLKAIAADITTLKVDAIVNAANSTLLGGGGVDGAIHRAAGPGLLKECRRLGGCQTGEAKLTDGYGLYAKHVIHTVGPVWHGGARNEPGLLRNCYWNSLEIARKRNFRSIAFPCISAGVYGYPKKAAALIAIKTAREFIIAHKINIEIIFCVFAAEDLEIYAQALTEIPKTENLQDS